MSSKTVLTRTLTYFRERTDERLMSRLVDLEQGLYKACALSRNKRSGHSSNLLGWAHVVCVMLLLGSGKTLTWQNVPDAMVRK